MAESTERRGTVSEAPSSRLQTTRLSELQVTGIDKEPTASLVSCATCALVRSRAGRSGAAGADAGYLGEDGYLDEEVLVMLRAATDGALVVPRRHVGDLTALPPSELGRMLAGLRRASVWAQERCRVAALRIEVTHEPPASSGHVCFRLVATVPGES